MAAIDDQTLTDAVKPKSVTNGDVSTTRRDLREQIEAAEYLARLGGAAAPLAVLRANTQVAKPPGAV